MSSTLTTRTLVSGTRERGLKRLLGPTDVATFLQHGIGEEMLHISGPPDRWADLFGWGDLNAALNHGLVSHPRMRLMLKGTAVAPEQYTYERGGRLWPDAQGCQQLMAEGATLILMSIEGLNPRLEAFVRELEHDFRAHVRVDAVATCASVPGLNVHWDNAECFNVQLDGQKDWQITRPDRPYPLTATHFFAERKDVTKTDAPATPPTWSGTVVPGDLIYLPRGWWHVVTPRVSPSLHLSIAADIPTFTDFLRWLAQQAATQEVARRIIPSWTSVAERGVRSSEALDALRGMVSLESLEAYLTELDGSSPARPDFALPQSAAPGGPNLEPRTRVRLQSTRPLNWTEADDLLTFTWRGQSFRFNAQLEPTLRKLETMQAVTVEELSEGTNRMLTNAFIVTLLTSGLLVVTERPSSSL